MLWRFAMPLLMPWLARLLPAALLLAAAVWKLWPVAVCAVLLWALMRVRLRRSGP